MVDLEGLIKTIDHLRGLEKHARERGDLARAEELQRVIKEYGAFLARQTSVEKGVGRLVYGPGMTYVQLGPDDQREVRVLHSDGVWYPGWLEAYRQVEGVWEAYVRYTIAPSETYLGWFEEGRIRGGRLG